MKENENLKRENALLKDMLQQYGNTIANIEKTLENLSSEFKITLIGTPGNRMNDIVNHLLSEQNDVL